MRTISTKRHSANEIINYLNVVSVLLIVFSLPFSIRLNSIFIVIFFITALLIAYKQQTNISFPWPFYIPILLYFTFIISFFNARSVKFWFSDIETEAALLIFPLCFIFSKSNLTRQKLETVLYMFASATILCCFIAHGIVLASMLRNGDTLSKSFEWYYSYAELVRPMGIDPIYLSLYVIFTIFVLFNALQSKPKLILYPIIVILIAYLIFFLFLLSSRIGIVSFILTCAAQSFIYLKKRALIVSLSATTILITVLFFYVSKIPLASERFKPMMSDLEAVFSSDSTKKVYDNRAIIYKCAFDVLSKNVSLMGLGPGNDQVNLDNCYSTHGFAKLENFNPHNQYLSVLLRYGIIGLILFSLLMVVPFLLSLRYKNMLMNVLSLSMIFTALAESTFSRQKGVVFYVFFYCLLITYSYCFIESKKNEQRI